MTKNSIKNSNSMLVFWCFSLLTIAVAAQAQRGRGGRGRRPGRKTRECKLLFATTLAVSPWVERCYREMTPAVT